MITGNPHYCIGMREKDAALASRDAEIASLLALVEQLAGAIEGINAGFDAGVFVRDVSRDHESAWAVRAFPHLAALGRAQAALAAAAPYRRK